MAKELKQKLSHRFLVRLTETLKSFKIVTEVVSRPTFVVNKWYSGQYWWLTCLQEVDE